MNFGVIEVCKWDVVFVVSGPLAAVSLAMKWDVSAVIGLVMLMAAIVALCPDFE